MSEQGLHFCASTHTNDPADEESYPELWAGRNLKAKERKMMRGIM